MPRPVFTPEERLARKKEADKRWRTNNPAAKKAADRRWRVKNYERYLAYNEAWSAAHPEVGRKRLLRWLKAHPEIARARERRRRAQKTGALLNDLTTAQWRTIQEAQNHCCAYCGKRCKGRLTQDHITPLSKGGSHTLHNVIGACKSCNSKKRIGPPLKAVQPLLL